MGDNSVAGNASSAYQPRERLIIIQILVSLFLSINAMLIATFFMKDFFYTTMRYILFATTLLSDCLLLILTNVMVLMNYFLYPIQVWCCVILVSISSVYTFVTAVTLTAMTLERYVAICIPLRHAELCSTHRSQQGILIIHGLSSVSCILILLTFFASASLTIFKQNKLCSVEILILHSWQGDLRSAMNQIYFFIMFITIIFSYFKIMKVVKVASGENKESSQKGLRTVMLHAFQLLLGIIQMWCPFIHNAVLEIDFMLYWNVRYFNYVIFSLTPRCLSPLIYGLRDEKFFLVLKNNVLCCFVKKKSLDF